MHEWEWIESFVVEEMHVQTLQETGFQQSLFGLWIPRGTKALTPEQLNAIREQVKAQQTKLYEHKPSSHWEEPLTKSLLGSDLDCI